MFWILQKVSAWFESMGQEPGLGVVWTHCSLVIFKGARNIKGNTKRIKKNWNQQIIKRTHK